MRPRPPRRVQAVRAGDDIDLEGVTGPGTYTAGGVNAVVQSYTPFTADGSVGEAVILDADRALEAIQQIQVEAECDANNECTW
ncbi:MAG: hypothetical protein ACXW1Y_02920 [Acidimicrobiia bacterium]